MRTRVGVVALAVAAVVSDRTPWSEAGRVRGRSVVLVLVGGLEEDLRVMGEAVGRV
ncbi:hypothetical protein [Mariniluteicoccus flavus]